VGTAERIGGNAYTLLARVAFQPVGEDHTPMVFAPDHIFAGPYDLGLALDAVEVTRSLGLGTAVIAPLPETELWAMIYHHFSTQPRIGVPELLAVVRAFNATITEASPPEHRWADFDRNGHVGVPDLLAIVRNFALERPTNAVTYPSTFPEAWRVEMAVGSAAAMPLGGMGALSVMAAPEPWTTGIDTTEIEPTSDSVGATDGMLGNRNAPYSLSAIRTMAAPFAGELTNGTSARMAAGDFRNDLARAMWAWHEREGLGHGNEPQLPATRGAVDRVAGDALASARAVRLAALSRLDIELDAGERSLFSDAGSWTNRLRTVDHLMARFGQWPSSGASTASDLAEDRIDEVFDAILGELVGAEPALIQ
jgi:hypothetical protein